MANVLRYKGFAGSVETDLEENKLYGKLLYVNDLVNYEASTIEELKTEFNSAVDDYLQLCSELGREPCKPLTGSFNVRVGQDRHRKIADLSIQLDLNINQIVCRAIDEFSPGQKTHHVHYHINESSQLEHSYEWRVTNRSAHSTSPFLKGSSISFSDQISQH